jgi:hypothetical protein
LRGEIDIIGQDKKTIIGFEENLYKHLRDCDGRGGYVQSIRYRVNGKLAIDENTGKFKRRYNVWVRSNK